MLTEDQIRKQSERAYGQWCVQWREHAKAHSKYEMKSLQELEHSGVGKAILCVGNGYSLEHEIETIQKYQHNVDIICCDKSLKHLINHGIKPKYCYVADANVSYSKYLHEVRDQVDETILIANVCANPEWADKGNWKELYFTVVMDVLQSEKEFQALSGCPNVIAAGTNVSNSLIIFLTQCDNKGRKNFFAYDKMLLIGFDYSWMPNKPYYAFDEDGGGKHNYMRHVYLMNQNKDLCYSSTNLIFSAKWLDQYVAAFKLPIVQCSRFGVFGTKYRGSLSEQMQYNFKQEDAKTVQECFSIRRELSKKRNELDRRLREISRDHYYAFIASVS